MGTALTFLAGLAALVASVSALAPWAVRRAFRVPRRVDAHTPADFGLPFETVRLKTANDKHLFAWFVPPPLPGPAPVVVVVHGWGGNAGFMLPFAPLFHRAGYGTLLFDARCHGRSDDDDFASLPRFAEDLEHVLAWLEKRREMDPGRIALLGHSVGAGAALLVASRRPEVAAVISLAAFADPAEIMRQMMRAKRVPLPLIWWALYHIERTIGQRYAAIAPRTTISKVRCPVLLVHGEADRTVPVDDARILYAAARASDAVELLTVPGADHFSLKHLRDNAGFLTAFLDRAFDKPRFQGSP